MLGGTNALFYEGPYIKADGNISKQIVIARASTRSRTAVTKIAKTLSKDGKRKDKVVTGTIPEIGFYVRAQSGRVVKLPKAVKRAREHHRVLLRKTSRSAGSRKTSRVAKFFK